jgi:hypothetical protein
LPGKEILLSLIIREVVLNRNLKKERDGSICVCFDLLYRRDYGITVAKTVPKMNPSVPETAGFIF